MVGIFQLGSAAEIRAFSSCFSGFTGSGFSGRFTFGPLRAKRPFLASALTGATALPRPELTLISI